MSFALYQCGRTVSVRWRFARLASTLPLVIVLRSLIQTAHQEALQFSWARERSRRRPQGRPRQKLSTERGSVPLPHYGSHRLVSISSKPARCFPPAPSRHGIMPDPPARRGSFWGEKKPLPPLDAPCAALKSDCAAGDGGAGDRR